MTCSLAEFQGAVARAFGPAAAIAESRITLTVGDCRLALDLFPEPDRRFGALLLPALRVEIAVLGGSEDAAAALLARVDQATQRGGG